jgi:hypothetical protein
MTSSTKTKKNKQALLKQALLTALSINCANIQQSCIKIGVSRRTFYNWCDDDVSFKEEYDHLSEGLIDNAESQLHKLIQNGHVTAIIFFLKTKGKSRGYIESQDTTLKVVEEVPTTTDIQRLYSELNISDININ